MTPIDPQPRPPRAQAITEVCLLLARVRYRDDLEKHRVAGSRAGERYFRFLKTSQPFGTNRSLWRTLLFISHVCLWEEEPSV